MKHIDPNYFDYMYLLYLIRLGKVPPCLDAPRAKRKLLQWIVAILGAN